jgi:mannose-6-phosphate isomerase-like protein (cupin superfamily)
VFGWKHPFSPRSYIYVPFSDQTATAMDKINIEEKLNLISDHWNPRIAAELNGQQVKLAKIKGEFIWHHHEAEDELFYVLKGVLKMEFRDRTVVLHEGEMLVVPRGIEHRPVAENEVSLLLFEPESTLNTGNKTDDKMTKHRLNRI